LPSFSHSIWAQMALKCCGHNKLMSKKYAGPQSCRKW